MRTTVFLRLFCITLALAPATALAMQETVLSFANNNVPGQWDVGGMGQPQLLPEGVLLHAESDGSFITRANFAHRVQVVTLVIQGAPGMQAALVWNQKGDGEGNFHPLPFTLSGNGFEEIKLNVEAFPEWHSSAVNKIGIVVPQGDVVIKEIRFQGWNIFERWMEAVKSFWKFDSYLLISINFLWGPVITFNPVGTAHLFETMPPRGNSGMWLIYGGTLIALAAAALWQRKNGRSLKRAHVACVLIAAWLIFDVRMGTEMLSYVKYDWDHFVSSSASPRVFRTYYTLNDVIERAEPYLKGTKSYVAIGPEQSPFLALIRYYLYPELPVVPKDSAGVSTWFVYGREDVTLTDDGRIAIQGDPVSPPGEVIVRFEPHSFLFRVRP